LRDGQPTKQVRLTKRDTDTHVHRSHGELEGTGLIRLSALLTIEFSLSYFVFHLFCCCVASLSTIDK
jgi:hypothetical protein